MVLPGPRYARRPHVRCFSRVRPPFALRARYAMSGTERGDGTARPPIQLFKIAGLPRFMPAAPLFVLENASVCSRLTLLRVSGVCAGREHAPHALHRRATRESRRTGPRDLRRIRRILRRFAAPTRIADESRGQKGLEHTGSVDLVGVASPLCCYAPASACPVLRCAALLPASLTNRHRLGR